ncbi:SDR family oxidoreductase [Paenibacillus hexagrammi]|uniref:SDR family oxidoreductase n=1 Tax=Paenibacillus hexagrammi TaxID=2908839 RepID=A0ABY3SNC2_9BACL|nr:SDR family oxidoreductase [Paenibacillus sp. YPD9-1]UJF34978.1 SDR family oxidoreductase [Paenibacillus sp. YPD9-1]
MTNTQPVAVVTGASSGFGLLTSISLAGCGFRVIAAMRDTSKQAALLERAREAELSKQISVIQMDVHDHSGVEQAIRQVAKEYGRMDLLVNNAGFAAGGFVEDVPMRVWREQLETNVFGLIAVTKAVLPYMRERGSGTIINVSSISGQVALPGYAPYSTSKFAVEGFSEALRLEMKPFGVRVVLVEPGAYKTNIWEKGFRNVSVSELSPYRKMLDLVMGVSQKVAAASADPQEVAEKIAQIARTSNPSLRYPLGRGIRLHLWGKSLLPWSWYEFIIQRMMKP